MNTTTAEQQSGTTIAVSEKMVVMQQQETTELFERLMPVAVEILFTNSMTSAHALEDGGRTTSWLLNELKLKIRTWFALEDDLNNLDWDAQEQVCERLFSELGWESHIKQGEVLFTPGSDFAEAMAEVRNATMRLFPLIAAKAKLAVPDLDTRMKEREDGCNIYRMRAGKAPLKRKQRKPA